MLRILGGLKNPGTCCCLVMLFLVGCGDGASERVGNGDAEGKGGPAEIQEFELGAPDVHIELLEVLDHTGVAAESGKEPLEAHLDRILIHWWESNPVGVHGIVQDDESGDTVRVIFQGRAKPGTVELSFLASALDQGTVYRWLLADENTADTIQSVRFRIPF